LGRLAVWRSARRRALLAQPLARAVLPAAAGRGSHSAEPDAIGVSPTDPCGGGPGHPAGSCPALYHLRRRGPGVSEPAALVGTPRRRASPVGEYVRHYRDHSPRYLPPGELG